MRARGVVVAIALALACTPVAHAKTPPRPVIDPVQVATVPGLSADAVVLWDTLGVPHIHAESMLDLYRALGYVTARDRLWQIDWMRRRARGTAASLLGNSSLRDDGAARILGTSAWAESAAARCDPAAFATRAVDAFAEGVNAYIDAAAPLPREYGALGKKPLPWRRSDTVALILAQGLSLDFDTGEIDSAHRRERWSTRREDAFTRFDPLVRYDTVEGETRAGESATRGAASRDAREASNAWAVSGARSASGRPLLANDPHLDLTWPSTWYVVHLQVSDTLDAAGAMVPGVPLIISGRSRHAAWGVTALGADVVDYTTELLSADGRAALAGDRWVPLERRSLGLRYKVGPISLPVSYTRDVGPHGPVLLRDRDGRRGFAVRWAPLERSTIDLGAVGIERAASVEEVRSHVRHISTPTLNVIMADDAGHIGYQAVGTIPRRAGPSSPYPVPGWLPHDEWDGFLPPDSLPSATDPARGVLVSANNEPSRRGPVLGAYAANDFRAARIDALLSAATGPLTSDDMARIQLDVRVPEADAFLDSMCAIVERAEGFRADDARAVETLRAWSRRAEREETGATLFRAWLVRTRRRCEMTGSRGLYAHMLRDAWAAEWWDDPATPAPENAPAVLLASLHEAEARLADSLGADPAGWTWERAHRARVAHAIPSFAGPVVPAPGDQNTVNHGSSALPASTTYTHGVSLRVLTDLGDAETLRVCLPGANRGDADAAETRRAVERWSRGEYATVRLAMPAGAERREAWSLTPPRAVSP